MHRAVWPLVAFGLFLVLVFLLTREHPPAKVLALFTISAVIIAFSRLLSNEQRTAISRLLRETRGRHLGNRND